MAKIESYAPGSFCWADVATTDAAAAKQFYVLPGAAKGSPNSFVALPRSARDIIAPGGKTEYGQNRKLRARLILLGGTRDHPCGGRETVLRGDVRLDRSRHADAGRRLHSLSIRRQRCGRRVRRAARRASPLGRPLLGGLRRRDGGAGRTGRREGHCRPV